MVEPAKKTRRWPWQKEVVELPPFDDVNCPYAVKPSELFKINEDKDMGKLRELGGVTGLCKVLHTDHHRGLDPAGKGEASVEEHQRVYGANTLPSVPQKNFFVLCFENVQDPIILLLIAAALVSTVLGAALEEQRKEGEWIEGIAIWVAVAVVIMVGAGNDYQKDLQFRKLNAQKDIIEVTVTRGGDTLVIKNTELVVGDVYLINMGDKVVADGIMIDGFHLVIDEASLTGESGVDQLVEIIKVLGTPTKEEIHAMNPNYTEFKFPQIKPHPWTKVFSKRMPPDAIDLVSRLLQYAPQKRYTAYQAMTHPFFDELRDPATLLPNGKPLPPLFNWLPGELDQVPADIVEKLQSHAAS